VHWDNPAPVLAALVEYQGQVVLARNRAWAAGAFGLITGFLERGEDPAAGVAREVKEELALDTLATTLIGVYPFARKHEVIIAYHVVGQGEIGPQRRACRVPADCTREAEALGFWNRVGGE
jgi:NAD+ diphosphatase